MRYVVFCWGQSNKESFFIRPQFGSQFAVFHLLGFIKPVQHFNLNVFTYNPFKIFCQHWIIKRQASDPSDKNTPCSLFSSCWLQPYWLRFHGSSERTLTRNVAFLDILMQKKKYYQHVRNTFLAVSAKPVPVWGKRGEMRGLLREEKLSWHVLCAKY